MMWILFVYAVSCTSSQEYAIRCKERCALKGMDSVVKNEKCNCLEPEEVGKEVFKVETNLRGKVLNDDSVHPSRY